MQNPTPSLRMLAIAADQDGHHIYTAPRDSDNWQANAAWQAAATPEAIIALIDEGAALRGQVQERDNAYRAALARIAELEQGKCLLQIAEPVPHKEVVNAFREYISVHDGIQLDGRAMDEMAESIARIALDFNPSASAQPTQAQRKLQKDDVVVCVNAQGAKHITESKTYTVLGRGSWHHSVYVKCDDGKPGEFQESRFTRKDTLALLSEAAAKLIAAASSAGHLLYLSTSDVYRLRDEAAVQINNAIACIQKAQVKGAD